MNKKILLSVLLASFFVPSVFAYEEIDCSTDVVFGQNSCNQCFNGGTKAQGDYVGLLKDDWINATDSKKILYKEEQKKPSLLNLSDASVAWSQTPSEDGFWEYTPEFDALYSKNEEGNILEAGKRVTWLKSKEGYAYKLDKNAAAANTNIGLLIYPISTHTIGKDGTPSIDNQEHKECILFKSASASQKAPVVTTQKTNEVKHLPKTGPSEYVLLLLLSMALGVVFLKLRKNA